MNKTVDINSVIHDYPGRFLRAWLGLKAQSGQTQPAQLMALLGEKEPARILEIGCGYGLFSHCLAQLYPNAEVLGIDLNVQRIQAAQASAKNQPNLRFEHCNALELPKESWDLIAMIDVLHHVGKQNQQPLLEQTCQMLRPGGQLLLREIWPEANLLKTANAHIFDVMFYWEVSHFLPQATLKHRLSQAGYGQHSVAPNLPHSYVFPYITYVADKRVPD